MMKRNETVGNGKKGQPAANTTPLTFFKDNPASSTPIAKKIDKVSTPKPAPKMSPKKTKYELLAGLLVALEKNNELREKALELKLAKQKRKEDEKKREKEVVAETDEQFAQLKPLMFT